MSGSRARVAYLTPAEAATELSCSTKTVLRAIKRGHLKSVTYGRLVRIPRASFDRFLADHATSS